MSLMLHRRLAPPGSTVLALGLLLCACLLPAAERPAARPPAGPPARALNLPGELSDERMENYLDENAERILKSGQTVKMSELLRQLHHRSTPLQWGKPPTNRLATTELATRARASVLVIGDLYKCKKCPRWHVGVSSGFMLSENGICATCYHVVNVPESPTLVAMTGNGHVVPVREVLAGNPHTDVAILRLDGSGYVPLPLDTNAPVGSAVRVLSHPDDHFFTLSEGIISRYVSVPLEKGGGEVTMMAVTADFGAGSSGAPVFNERGGVIGMVNNTQSLYYDPKRGKDLQMVFKHCLPSQYIQELLR